MKFAYLISFLSVCVAVPLNHKSKNAVNLKREVEVVYMRHGRSMGNEAMAQIKKFHAIDSLKAALLASDGELTTVGKGQAVARIEQMTNKDFLVYSVLDVHLVLVSPLCRAMQTAVVAWLAAWKTENYRPDQATPTFQVCPHLREKVKSSSDRPSRNVEQCLNSAFTFFETQAAAASKDLATTEYARHKTAITNGITTTYDRGEESENGLQFSQMILTLHNKVLPGIFSGLPDANRVLIVAHSGLARFAFSHLLPGPEASTGGKATVKSLTPFIAGGRFVYPLENCGVLHLKLVIEDGKSSFEPFQPNWGGLAETGGVELSAGTANFNKKHGEPGPMWRASDYNAQWQVRHFLVEKYNYARYQKRWIRVMSDSDGNHALSWSDKWGKLKGGISLTCLTKADVKQGTSNLGILGDALVIISYSTDGSKTKQQRYKDFTEYVIWNSTLNSATEKVFNIPDMTTMFKSMAGGTCEVPKPREAEVDEKDKADEVDAENEDGDGILTEEELLKAVDDSK